MTATQTLNTVLDVENGLAFVMLDGAAIGYYTQRPDQTWHGFAYGMPYQHDEHDTDTEPAIRAWIENHWQEAHHG
jgi:hypothetical protein